MTHAITPSGSTDALDTWVDLIVCPDCRQPVQRSGDHITCPACQRVFPRIAASYELLPSGIQVEPDVAAPVGRGWRSRFVGSVYTRHNRSRHVAAALRRVLSVLRPGEWGLNLGSADTDLHPRLLNLDVRPSPHVRLVATAQRLPLAEGRLACVVSQEVFEHLSDPHAAAREVARVLRPGGLFYVQTPFVMGLHSLPHDYWRFTDRGLCELLAGAGLEVVEVGVAVGAGTAMYRIAVEFAASMAAAAWRRLYLPAKGLAAVLLAPLRWADAATSRQSPVNRIPAGFYAIGRKP
jgi:SAM-dependent methyltransferase